MQRDPSPTRKHLQQTLAGLFSRYTRVVPPRVRAVPFWLTVCLPWTILLLTLSGVASERPDVLAALVGATLVSAVLGHDHSQR